MSDPIEEFCDMAGFCYCKTLHKTLPGEKCPVCRGKEALDHYRTVLADKEQAEAECARQKWRVGQWAEDYQRVRDEHAETILRLQKAVGKCGLTEYQPEADLEIEWRIKAIKAERDRLREALEWYGDTSHYYNTGQETAMEDKGSRARKALEDKP